MREVNISQDYPEIASWYEAHGQPVPPKDWFEAGYGLIEPGIAATFLYCCANRAYIEDTIGNPKADPNQRDAALINIGLELEGIAKESGIKYLVAATNHSSVIERAQKVGYKIARGQFYQVLKVIN